MVRFELLMNFCHSADSPRRASELSNVAIPWLCDSRVQQVHHLHASKREVASPIGCCEAGRYSRTTLLSFEHSDRRCDLDPIRL